MRHKLILVILMLLVLGHYGWLLKRQSAEWRLRDEVHDLRQRLGGMRRVEHELAALRGLNSKLSQGFGLGRADSSHGLAGTVLSSSMSWENESSLLSLPVRGRFSRGFVRGGWPGGLSHPGVDFACEAGEPVAAAAGGHVLFSGRTERLGELVLIQHGDGLVTGYGHLARALPQVGDRVARGELIGQVARGMEDQGSHLHFSVQREGKPMDPVFVLDMEIKEKQTE